MYKLILNLHHSDGAFALEVGIESDFGTVNSVHIGVVVHISGVYYFGTGKMWSLYRGGQYRGVVTWRDSTV